MDKLELIFKKGTEMAEKVINIDCSHNELKHNEKGIVDVGKLHELALYQCVAVQVKAVYVGTNRP